jgi:hypothetical protein
VAGRSTRSLDGAMIPVTDWLQRKLSNRIATIGEPMEVRAECRRNRSGHMTVSGVTIKAEPASSFQLAICVTSDPDFRCAIEDTIMMRLLASLQPILGVHIAVTEATEDKVWSSYETFRNATEQAMDEILKGPKGLTNIVWQWK